MSDFLVLARFAVVALTLTIPITVFLFRAINVRRDYTISDRKEALVIGAIWSVILGFLMSFLVSLFLVALVWGIDPGGFLAFIAFALKVSLAVMLLVVPPLWLMIFAISFVPSFFAKPEGGSR